MLRVQLVFWGCDRQLAVVRVRKGVWSDSGSRFGHSRETQNNVQLLKGRNHIDGDKRPRSGRRQSNALQFTSCNRCYGAVVSPSDGGASLKMEDMGGGLMLR